MSHKFFVPVQLGHGLGIQVLIAGINFALAFGIIGILALPQIAAVEHSLFVYQRGHLFRGADGAVLHKIGVLDQRHLRALALPEFHRMGDGGHVAHQREGADHALLIGFDDTIVVCLTEAEIIGYYDQLLAHSCFLCPYRFR